MSFGMHLWAQKKKNHCLRSNNKQLCQQPWQSVISLIMLPLSIDKRLFHIRRWKDLLLLTFLHTKKLIFRIKLNLVTMPVMSLTCISYPVFLLFIFSQVVEEWKTHTSYDMGLETERAAREKLQKQSIHHEEVKRHISYWKFSRVSLKKLSYSEQDTKAGFKKKKKEKVSI